MKNFTFFIISCFCFSLFAQQKPTLEFRNCGTDAYNQALLQSNPNMMGGERFENSIAKKISEIQKELEANPNRALQFTIPVVVHVIHNGEPIGVGANISDAQVLSQIQVLNEDFRRIIGTRGFNTNPVGADVEVEFCLAQKTPDGCITNGIDRVDMSAISTSWGGSGAGSNTNTILKPSTIWDPSKYMNMWSVNFSDGTLLGFAQFPGGPANTDGVVSNYTYFGSNDADGVSIPGAFNLGRTMTHEVGHYLGLFHTFQGGCSGGGDLCADTPAVDAPNFGCPTGHVSCGSVDMVQNYMDYTDDSCMNVFTINQKARVIAILATSANRPNTTTSDVCNALAPVANDVSVDINSLSPEGACSNGITPNVRIQNFGTSTLTSAVLTYNVDGATNLNYNWTGTLTNGQFVDVDLPTIMSTPGTHAFNVSAANPNGTGDQRDCNDLANAAFALANAYPSTSEIRLNIVPDNYGSEITWTFSSGSTVLYSGGPYTDGNTTAINQVFTVDPNVCYTFTIEDDFGDGICCNWGPGSYTLRTDDDTVIFTGGQFSDSETTEISTIALGVDEYFISGNIYLYPNPASNQFQIKISNSNQLPDNYEIYNMLGQTIARKQIATDADLAINSSALSNGMYFIRISKDDGSVTLPFIKK